MNLYMVSTNGFGTNDFIIFNDLEKAQKEFEACCRVIQKENNLPKEAVDKCIKLRYLDAQQVGECLKLENVSEEDFCTLEEIVMEEWQDQQCISTWFDFVDVDELLEERGL